MPDKKKDPPGASQRAEDTAHIEQAPSTPPQADDQELPAFLDRRKKKSVLDILPIHTAARKFPMMNHEELLAQGSDIKRNGLATKITLWCENRRGYDDEAVHTQIYILDGRNRLAAMELVGIPISFDGQWLLRDDLGEDDDESLISDLLYATFTDDDGSTNPGSCPDPYAYVLSANVRRRHLRPEEKYQAIAALLKAKPELSDRAIAKDLGFSPTTVGKVRAEASPNVQGGHKPDVRKEASGRKARGRKPEKPKAAPANEIERLLSELMAEGKKPAGGMNHAAIAIRAGKLEELLGSDPAFTPHIEGLKEQGGKNGVTGSGGAVMMHVTYIRRIRETGTTEYRPKPAPAAPRPGKTGKPDLRIVKTDSPASEQVIVVFGERLWPAPQPNRFVEYTYAQLCAAIWTFRDLDGLMSGGSPASRGISIRNSTRWVKEFLLRANYSVQGEASILKVYNLISGITHLRAERPDGECKFPPTPKVEQL